MTTREVAIDNLTRAIDLLILDGEGDGEDAFLLTFCRGCIRSGIGISPELRQAIKAEAIRHRAILQEMREAK